MLLAQYQKNLGIIREKIGLEQAASQALEQAKRQNTALLAQDLNRMTPNEIASRIQVIVDDLKQVQPGTTSYDEAQSLLAYANQKLAQLQAGSR